MALPFTDNFNRADGGLGANWTTLASAMSISSNVAVGSAANSAGYYNVDTPNADCYVQAKFATLPSGGTEYLTIYLRFNTTSFNGYGARYINGTGMQIVKIAGGVVSQLALMGSAPSAGQVVKLTASGTTLTMYYDGVSAGSTTDSSYSAAGRSAIAASNSGSGGSLDDFETGNLTTAKSLPIPRRTMARMSSHFR